VAAWKSNGGEDDALRIERVPGAYELPLAARAFALAGSVDAVIALGCVIRGDTAHFDFVAGECAHGLQRVMLDTGVPVSFGVLTVENQTQALERASPDSLNKGGEAMTTALAMVDLLRRVK
jgi:6,7-dimethyl-8-ribityllumazine synthase